MTNQHTRLASNRLGVPGIVFMVLAAVAPLTGIVVISVLGIGLGNGGGMVGSFLLVTLVLSLFAVGYAQMSKETVSAGGFYAFAVKGLGRPAGLSTGFVAVLGYNFFVAGAVGTVGFFFQTIVAQLIGFDLAWFWWGLIIVAIAFALTTRGIEVSAKLLGVCLVLEVAILIVFDFSVLFTSGFSFEAFTPKALFSGSLGIGLLFASTAFVGFEATGLFSEEAKNPTRTIPRATFVAIVFIGLFAAFTTWAIVSATGVSDAQGVALEHLVSGDLVFVLSNQYLGTPLTTLMMLLLLVSLFAALMALHNAATRYLYSLGRAGLLPQFLSHTNARGVPQKASIVQFTFALAVAAIFALAGGEPLTSIVPVMTGIGTLSILTLQLIAALAVVVYFRRRRDRRLVTTLAAPGLGLLGLIFIVVLAIWYFPIIAGSDAPVVALLPWLLLLAVVLGLGFALYLKLRRPDLYESMNNDLEESARAHLSTTAPEGDNQR